MRFSTKYIIRETGKELVVVFSTETKTSLYDVVLLHDGSRRLYLNSEEVYAYPPQARAAQKLLKKVVDLESVAVEYMNCEDESKQNELWWTIRKNFS